MKGVSSNEKKYLTPDTSYTGNLMAFNREDLLARKRKKEKKRGVGGMVASCAVECFNSCPSTQEAEAGGS